MPVSHSASLRLLNTFGIDMPAAALMELTDAGMLASIGADQTLPQPMRVLGGGSNVLLTAPVEGTVLLNRLRGIGVEDEDERQVWLRAAAGEVWHDLVLYAIGNGWGGIENLALIPGTVGASPIQNIGAYGVEVKDTIETVEAWNWESAALQTFSNAECAFGYRDSIFKQELKGKVLVTAVTFRLQKKPVINTAYGAIAQELESMGIRKPGVRDVAQAVINIRRSKLPDPAQVGNAGSFFKNPTLPAEQVTALAQKHPLMPVYPVGEGFLKVPAGWLIEACGWKGKRVGDAGVHPKQALVLVNYGRATGAEIWALSDAILKSVKDAFGIELEREVQVW